MFRNSSKFILTIAALLFTAQAFAASDYLLNGSKYEVAENILWIIGEKGAKTKASDGTYKTSNGDSIVVQGGIIVQGGLQQRGNSTMPSTPPTLKGSTPAGGGNKTMLNPQPLPPKTLGEIKPAARGASVTLNPQPLPPKASGIANSGGAKGDVMLNPQPLPPKASAPKSSKIKE